MRNVKSKLYEHKSFVYWGTNYLKTKSKITTMSMIRIELFNIKYSSDK